MAEPFPLEVSVGDAARLRASSPAGLRMLDVREPDEFAICRIEGAELMPLATVPHAAARLPDAEAPLLVYCHHGMRSLRAVEMLRHLGYPRAQSIAGGIDRWSEEIDPAVPRY